MSIRAPLLHAAAQFNIVLRTVLQGTSYPSTNGPWELINTPPDTFTRFRHVLVFPSSACVGVLIIQHNIYCISSHCTGNYVTYLPKLISLLWTAS